MISVVIPTLNDEAHLAGALGSLVSAAVDGVVREVIVADGGSTDRTLDIADGAGAEILKTEAGRGTQLKAGAERARFSWLLFLNADTILDAGWDREASHHIERVETGRRRPSAAAFKFALDDEGVWPRTLESFASLRTSLLKLPYGDQGLLISRRLYDEVGGFGALPMMEDLDLIRRLGRSRVALLTTRAMKGPEQHRREASFSRTARNQICLGLYLLGVPVSTIVSLSGAGHVPDGEPVAHRSLR
jgi:rSAM/selenodomain-associated transferase 2